MTLKSPAMEVEIGVAPPIVSFDPSMKNVASSCISTTSPVERVAPIILSEVGCHWKANTKDSFREPGSSKIPETSIVAVA
jgi:hypothetical protein